MLLKTPCKYCFNAYLIFPSCKCTILLNHSLTVARLALGFSVLTTSTVMTISAEFLLFFGIDFENTSSEVKFPGPGV